MVYLHYLCSREIKKLLSAISLEYKELVPEEVKEEDTVIVPVNVQSNDTLGKHFHFAEYPYWDRLGVMPGFLFIDLETMVCVTDHCVNTPNGETIVMEQKPIESAVQPLLARQEKSKSLQKGEGIQVGDYVTVQYMYRHKMNGKEYPVINVGDGDSITILDKDQDGKKFGVSIGRNVTNVRKASCKKGEVTNNTEVVTLDATAARSVYTELQQELYKTAFTSVKFEIFDISDESRKVNPFYSLHRTRSIKRQL